MGIGLRHVDRHVAVPTATVWRLLVELDAWPRWGPSVRRAALDGDADELDLAVCGRVWTPVGVALPFTITEFIPGRRWAWAVAGVPATAHEVRPDGQGCRVRFEVPWWATAYLPVCAVALGRIERMALAANR